MITERYPCLFIDTSDVVELDRLIPWGIFRGITTNPGIVAEEAKRKNLTQVDELSFYRNIAERFPQYPVSTQLINDPRFEALLEKARSFAALAPNIVVKVPMFCDGKGMEGVEDGKGLQLVTTLTRDRIKVNVTALMTAEQAMLTMMGDIAPAYVSLFFNRAKDGGENPRKQIENLRELIDKIGSSTKIIVGSIRTKEDIREALVSGAHIVTVPTDTKRQPLWEAIYHFKSAEFIEEGKKKFEEISSPQ